MVDPTEQEKSFTATNGGSAWPEDRICIKQERNAHSLQTKGFLQLSPEAAMLFAPFGCTHPPPALSDSIEPISKKMLHQVTSQAEGCMTHICVYRL